MSRRWNPYPPSRPRRPSEDGIRSRSRRGAIGEQWWSQRFVRALHNVADSGRLQRGRSYARSGQVMDLALDPALVTARVQGSRRKPYDVWLEVNLFTDAEWNAAEAAMAEQAIFLATLLAGEMPRDIEEPFNSVGLSLFPDTPGDLRTGCSCPDRANPCKHVAATLYLLAESFDADPFRILAWRGRTRDELISELRRQRAGTDEARSPAPTEHAGKQEGHADGPALADALNDFWTLRADAGEARQVPRTATVPDAVLRQLGPLRIETDGRDASELLAPLYARIVEHAGRRGDAE